MMDDREKSDAVIVARKPTNKTGQPAAEPVERRTATKRNASEQNTYRTQGRANVSHALDRVRQAVRLSLCAHLPNPQDFCGESCSHRVPDPETG